jgi:Uma2 family endonuclease
MRSSRPGRALEFLYPESDGKPMAETDHHRDVTVYLIEALKLWFRALEDVYVSGDLMVYYVEGDANVSVSPDVFVVKGVPNVQRRVYKLWEEPAPCVVIEVSSRSTKSEDLTSKFELYRDVLRVAEYYIYDPDRDYLRNRMRGWVLRAGQYVARRIVAGRIRSRELGLDLVDERGMLRLVDPRTARALPGLREADEARAQADEARRRADEARKQAEEALGRAHAENRRLREELARACRKRRS